VTSFADHLLVSCPLCGRDEADPYCLKEGFHIMRCRACTLVYVNPRLSLAALDRMYNAQTISSTQYYVQSAADDAPSFHRRLRWIEEHRSPGRLLDVGCGPGTFMSVAREHGWKVRGVDINAASIARCIEIGLDAVNGPFPHPALIDERFDAVVLNDVIEHLPEPKPALSHVRSMLAPGGILFLSTPDIGAAVARLSGVRWLHLKPVEHLTYFDRSTIARLLADTGFEVLRVGAIGRNRSVGLLLERLATYSGAVSRGALRLLPRWASRVSFPFNPGDEMAVLARVGRGQ
jgi:2-polyprenyl-3-methyl-5-hydroxy-6-metoxy-1,4-benzoquinol methylase